MNRLYSFKVLFVLLISALSLSLAKAQDFPMVDGTINTCAGVFFDGGFGAPYPDQNFTFTICPDNPGDAISVEFISFDVQTAPNNGSDVLLVYDNDAPTGAPAQYTGNALEDISVIASINNPTGCLTFVFISNTGNPQGLSGWSGLIECTTPCANPTSVTSFVSPAPPIAGLDSVAVCVGEPVTLQDAGSFVEPGFNIVNHIWDFDDGSIDSLNNTTVTHTFDEGGQYIVSHFVVDDNGCISQNAQPMVVVVSTLPLFDLVYPEEICVGTPATITGGATGVLWTSAPPILFAGESYLSDDQGNTFQNDLFINFFDNDQVVEECDEILDIFINMEHSYLGDLEMFIECPNGTQVYLIEFPNGGGGTFLGEPVDNGANTVSGTGYDYGWSSTSTLGAIDDNANSTNVDYTNNAGDNVSGNIVNPGIYEPSGNICDLVGCPLNGTWTFNVTDNLGADDGYIFNWGVTFDPSLYPDVTTFTPIYGPEGDSTYWNVSPDLNSISVDGNTATFIPDATGTYDFTYTAINNFGCSVDTTITITVGEIPEIQAFPNTLIECGGGTQLGVEFVGNPPPASCDFLLELFDAFGDGWNGGSIDVTIDGVTTNYDLDGSTAAEDTYEAIPLNGIAHGTAFSVFFNGGNWLNEVSFTITGPGGSAILQVGAAFGGAPADGETYTGSFSCEESLGNFNYLWSPAALIDNPNSQFPSASGVNESTWFTVMVSDAGNPDCFLLDSMLLEIPNGADAGLDVATCEAAYPLQGFTMGTPQWSSNEPSVVFNDANSLTPIASSDQSGQFEIYIEDLSGESCPVRDTVLVTFFNGIDIVEDIDNPECFGDCDGEMSVTGIGGHIEPGTDFGYQFSTGVFGNDPNAAFQLCAGTVTVTLTDNDGCFSTETFEIIEPPAPIIDSLTVTDETCADVCDGMIEVHAPTAAAYSFDGGATYELDATGEGFCPGFYTVFMQDPNGCSSSATATILPGDEPEAYFESEPYRASVLQPEFQLINLSEDHVSSDWFVGIDGVDGMYTEDSPEITLPSEPGDYPVLLVVTDSLGCLDSLMQTVTVIDEFQIFIPNAFSPNGDDINDVFHVMINDLDPSDYIFEVRDRSGRLIYGSTDYPTQWNGQSSTDYEYYVPDGVYVWFINARALSTTERREFSGQVTVIR